MAMCLVVDVNLKIYNIKIGLTLKWSEGLFYSVIAIQKRNVIIIEINNSSLKITMYCLCRGS